MTRRGEGGGEEGGPPVLNDQLQTPVCNDQLEAPVHIDQLLGGPVSVSLTAYIMNCMEYMQYMALRTH